MKTDINKTITTLEEARAYLIELNMNREGYHPDDDAFDIVWDEVNPTKAEMTNLNKRMEEVWSLIDKTNTVSEENDGYLDLDPYQIGMSVNDVITHQDSHHSLMMTINNHYEFNLRTNYHWDDSSWHNDACDSLYCEELNICLYLPNCEGRPEHEEQFNTFLLSNGNNNDIIKHFIGVDENTPPPIQEVIDYINEYKVLPETGNIHMEDGGHFYYNIGDEEQRYITNCKLETQLELAYKPVTLVEIKEIIQDESNKFMWRL